MLQTDCCAILGCLEKLFATSGEEKQKEPNKLKMMTMKQSKSIKIHLSVFSLFGLIECFSSLIMQITSLEAQGHRGQSINRSIVPLSIDLFYFFHATLVFDSLILPFSN